MLTQFVWDPHKFYAQRPLHIPKFAPVTTHISSVLFLFYLGDESSQWGSVLLFIN